MRIMLITVVCLALAAPASAGLYKWKDADGKIHFTDDPSKIPLDNRNKKDMKKLSSSKGGKSNLPSAKPAPKYLGTKKENLPGRDTGTDKQKVNDLKRLIQKGHYNH
ncbi:MAG: DUF4124 domain-containing protein [Deltaproteobacteria bacterium]|nr:DUF4124 domain-containing protein [Deltaproteobacteria bacterium]